MQELPSAAAPDATRRITPVILSGGSGTRLWPLSRKDRPKQMLSLVGEETMLQLTAARAADPALFRRPTIVTSAAQAKQVVAQLGREVRLILEPCARNTAAAVTLAALSGAPSDLLLVMPSDHLIADPTRFLEAVEKGVPAAENGMLVTFGIRPARAETGYGYIQCGEAVGDGVFRASRFHEKPDPQTAEAFVADKRYQWNAGIFLFKAGALLSAMGKHAEDIRAGCEQAMGRARRRANRLEPEESAFASVRSQSIDRAVMERAENVVVVPMDVGWSDLGSWHALHGASPLDDQGNGVTGPAELIGVTNCLVRSEGRRVVAIGVDGLAIVATADAVLVVPLADSQRVSEAVAGLAEKNSELL